MSYRARRTCFFSPTLISYLIISRSTLRVHICDMLFIFQLKESICVTFFWTSFSWCKKGTEGTPCVHNFLHLRCIVHIC